MINKKYYESSGGKRQDGAAFQAWEKLKKI
jgi:hypothetical protein